MRRPRSGKDSDRQTEFGYFIGKEESKAVRTEVNNVEAGRGEIRTKLLSYSD